jgi:2'-5' RNA ligase
MSEPIARPRQYVLWNEDFDPLVAQDQDFSGRPDAVFLAIQPPAEIAEHVFRLGARIHRDERLNCSQVLPRCLHLTLLGIDYFPNLSRAELEGILRALARVVMPSFLFALNQAVPFRNKSNWPFVLVGDDITVPGIHMLRSKLVGALREIGFGFKVPSFTPHMTLFRAKRKLAERVIEDVSWTVCDLVLIRSLHGHSRHEELGRWPLTAPAP